MAPKEVAGKADVMRHVKKHFAIFKGVEKAGDVGLQIEGQDRENSWPVLPDAQIKINGWWGRLKQVAPGDRAWVWLAVDREKKPVSVLMLADEVSEQDIHGAPYTLASCNVNACGSPKEHRRIIEEMIDEGLTDREIFERLKTDRGRDIWQPHLLR